MIPTPYAIKQNAWVITPSAYRYDQVPFPQQVKPTQTVGEILIVFGGLQIGRFICPKQ